MKIPHKPERENETVEHFIKEGPAQTQSTPKDNGGKKTGRRITTFSLMISDVDWLNQVLSKLNSLTERKITKSEVISAAIGILKEKNIEDILEIVKNR